MKGLLLLLAAIGVAGLAFLFYQSILRPEMVRWDCQRQYSTAFAVNTCVEMHKIKIHF
jgi:hypothetical protein